MKPYYDDGDGRVIYCGDCREILQSLDQPETCIVDPVWPNSVFPKISDPQSLFAEMCCLLRCKRLVAHLGCCSDPRFLASVPATLPFIRTCWLEYAHPSYRGRILMGSDVAYAFGVPPKAVPGRHLMPGKWKTLLVRDGSLLDAESLAAVAKQAAEANGQLWIERVGTADQTAVIIEDGMVRNGEPTHIAGSIPAEEVLPY